VYRGLLVTIMVLVIATGAMAQGRPGLAMVNQPVSKRVDQMSLEELEDAVGKVEAAATQLEAVTKSVVNLIDNLMSNLRGKKSVIIEDNNKMMMQFRMQKESLEEQIRKLIKEKARKDKEAKKDGNGKR
jgi:adenylosuccinate lyase